MIICTFICKMMVSRIALIRSHGKNTNFTRDRSAILSRQKSKENCKSEEERHWKNCVTFVEENSDDLDKGVVTTILQAHGMIRQSYKFAN